LDLLLLAALKGKPMHGYALMKNLRLKSDGLFQLSEGTIYPALHRLESDGLVKSGRMVENGRERRVYRITAGGKRQLTSEKEQWRKLATAMNSILETS